MSLTPRQADCLAFIKAHMAERPVPPSFQAIADHLGLKSKSGVARLIDGLQERGYVRRSLAHHYNIELCRGPGAICPHCGNRAGSAACIAAAKEQNAAVSFTAAPLASDQRRTPDQCERENPRGSA